jgi:hypothetical protein
MLPRTSNWRTRLQCDATRVDKVTSTSANSAKPNYATVTIGWKCRRQRRNIMHISSNEFGLQRNASSGFRPAIIVRVDH